MRPHLAALCLAQPRAIAAMLSSAGLAASAARTFPSLGEFLGSRLAAVTAALDRGADPPSPGAHVYLGNEAGDADSLVSPLCFAYLAASLEPGPSMPHVPLLSVPRGDLNLRPETRALLALAGE